ncbi:aldose 1-epimerase family protein [Arthrobacter sp. M4]|uniref:aldose 1-epimerase family protein n=1 Tax=Arthrobacter sp. M4 TaxID=218160 RepID=UPI001CDB9C68|nr:aldose 1-epimerase family protein [Arthrobacter sp. M4]MCA4131228.1 aldose 1-epimerase family protein [Arthrobacter sp. M4]
MSTTHHGTSGGIGVSFGAPVAPPGVDIQCGPYTARVTTLGGALRSLRFDGRDLVVPFDDDSMIPDYRGVICAPWPNRLADGRYGYNGAVHEVPVNEPERGTALHGLVFDKVWKLEGLTADSVELSCPIQSVEGYPFQLRVSVKYALAEDGLHCHVRAVNEGTASAPYGVCPHPYLVAGSAPLDEWSVSIPAEQFLAVTPDRLLPLGVAAVAGHEFDFRSERVLGPIEIDHAFTGLTLNSSGTASVRVFDPSGTGVELEWGAEWPWLQIHTADKPQKPDRLGLAVEPMTCPPDAFNSGTDVVLLAPGGTHMASWTIRALSR